MRKKKIIIKLEIPMKIEMFELFAKIHLLCCKKIYNGRAEYLLICS